MKKVLFGTTALVAAAFAGQALAKDVKLSITGGVTAGVGFGKFQEDTEAPTDDTDVATDFHIINEAEIQFKAKGTLDNGITVEVRVELEGYTTGDQMDENWVKVSSSFGSILIGNNDSALDNIAGGVGQMGGGVAGGSYDRDYEFVPGNIGNRLGDYSDEMAIHYYTPNIAGFEAGVSWAPGTSQGTFGDESDVDTNTDPENDNNEWSVGVAYGNSFGDVDFAIGGGYFESSEDDLGGGGDQTAYGGGVELGFGGFTLGGAVQFREDGEDDDEVNIYHAGVEYATGPWVFGVNGTYQETDDDNAESIRLNAAVGYELGDGVDLGLGIDYGEYDGDSADDDGIGGVLLLGVSF